MYIDSGRKADLALIEKKLKDWTISPKERQHLETTKQTIMRELQDPRIGEERERMLNATRAGDGAESEKIAKNLMRMTGQQAE